MKYFILAGERSGDLHGSNLIKALKQYDASAEIYAWGGDMMQENGAILLKHYRSLAFMGLIEVLRNLWTILRIFQESKKCIDELKPDAVVLIDYGGLNMRVAKYAKEKGYKVFYYIPPKVWAWNQKRALKLKKYVDKIFVIFPFEVDFFQKFDMEVEYVGNPLLDSIHDFKPNTSFLEKNNLQKPYIALLPGSRKQEVEMLLETMTAIKPRFPHHQFVIASVGNLPESLYQKYTQNGIIPIQDASYDVLHHAQAALVASGTATLETALLNIPQVVCYRVHPITYFVGKLVLQVPYVSLVNLILGKESVKEVLQKDFTQKNVEYELNKIMEQSPERNQMLVDYETLQQKMGGIGASQNVGRRIVELLNKS